MRVVLKEHYYDLLNRHGYITAEMEKNAFAGVTAKVKSLVAFPNSTVSYNRRPIIIHTGPPRCMD